MRIFVFLHILTMFTAVAMGYGGMLMVLVAARTRDVATLRGVLATAEKIGPFIGPAFLLGILFGVIAIFTGGFDPLAPWLIIAYVLVVIAIVSASLVLAPFQAKLGQAMATAEDMAPADAILRDRRTMVLLALDTLVIVALIADMVLKPFS